MSDVNDGGQAFPHQGYPVADASGAVSGFEGSGPGMTLRDYFAAAALQGLLPKLPLVDQLGEHGPAVDDKVAHNLEIATSCYCLADAMLAARRDRECV